MHGHMNVIGSVWPDSVSVVTPGIMISPMPLICSAHRIIKDFYQFYPDKHYREVR